MEPKVHEHLGNNHIVSKNPIFFFIAFLSFCSFMQGQNLEAARIDSWTSDADEFVGFDKFGYCYTIKNNVFIKSKGKEILEYNNPATGKITHADIENPLLIVLFYENFNTIILLDNQLNEVRKISFSELNIPIVSHATGLASQNRLWIYDSLTQQIGLFDYLRNDYKSITTPFKQILKYYQTDFNAFQWIDEKGNRFACDVYGKVLTLGKVPDYDRMQIVSGRSLLFSKDGKLYLHNIEKTTTGTIAGVENSFKKFYYKDQILSIFTTGAITNYKIILP
ncbi:MAG TPA: hypothetical protein VK623_03470 [Flavobacterium sp.]|nr:hypothetical protein [Flavobacterium sp.]